MIALSMDRRRLLLASSACLWQAACATNSPIPAAPASLRPAQIREDALALRDAIDSAHPDLSHSVDPGALRHAIGEVVRAIDGPATVDEVWQRLSSLNPLLADGHLLVGYPDWRAMSTAHLAGGGGLFPLEVHVAEAGHVLALAPLGQLRGDVAFALRGQRITGINGLAADAVAARLARHVHGDSPTFRAGLLSSRWWLYYWKLLGAPASFELELSDGRRTHTATIPASGATPAVLSAETSFEHQYQLVPLAPGAALLKLGSFYWPNKDAFYAFTAQAFATLRASGVRRLLIDIRDNGGGDDDMWIEGVMPYIASRRYRWGSTYRKRVVQANPAKGEKPGDIVDGEISRWIEPRADQPNRFDGEVCVLVGRNTNSSAVLFSNVMQDFGFATIAGVGGAVRPRQSGGTRLAATLPHSRLAVWAPRFILNRPSGATHPRWLTPDIALADDPLQPRAMADAALAVMRPASRS